MWKLKAWYIADLYPAHDDILTAAAKGKFVGSGMALCGDAGRDMEWEYDSEIAAASAKARIAKIAGVKRVAISGRRGHERAK